MRSSAEPGDDGGVSGDEKVLEVLAWSALWLVFFALLVPVGVAGWAVGHYVS